LLRDCSFTLLSPTTLEPSKARFPVLEFPHFVTS
jgi:hypothetical protein